MGRQILGFFCDESSGAKSPAATGDLGPLFLEQRPMTLARPLPKMRRGWSTVEDGWIRMAFDRELSVIGQELTHPTGLYFQGNSLHLDDPSRKCVAPLANYPLDRKPAKLCQQRILDFACGDKPHCLRHHLSLLLAKPAQRA